MFESAENNGIHDTNLLIHAYFSYKNLGEYANALALLTSAIRDCKTNPRLSAPEIYYHLAEHYLMINQIREAVSIYEKYLLKPEVVTRQLFIRYARILKTICNNRRMRIECTRMLGGMFPCPQSCEDFYYDGFAQYLLGNTDRAQYDYERSQRYNP